MQSLVRVVEAFKTEYVRFCIVVCNNDLTFAERTALAEAAIFAHIGEYIRQGS